jgi:hypothetical protein
MRSGGKDLIANTKATLELLLSEAELFIPSTNFDQPQCRQPAAVPHWSCLMPLMNRRPPRESKEGVIEIVVSDLSLTKGKSFLNVPEPFRLNFFINLCRHTPR